MTESIRSFREKIREPVSCELGVPRGCLNAAMTEKALHSTDVDAAINEREASAMPQSVWMHVEMS
jgi:hypothetical protein